MTDADTTLLRLSKLMAMRGLCSRREADDYIERGWVSVNGEPAILGQKVLPSVQITLDRRAETTQSERVTILLNKPVGYVSAQAEKGYIPAVNLLVPERRWTGDTSPRRFSHEHVRGLAPAGRLDIDSTGLLVLTQDGRIAKTIIGETSEVEKEYLVRVKGRLSHNGLAKLNHGLSLDDKPLLPAEVAWQNQDQLRFVLHEGKKRQIRRMCELVGLEVVGLRRIRVGQVVLGNLPQGQWRYLSPDEQF